MLVKENNNIFIESNNIFKNIYDYFHCKKDN